MIVRRTTARVSAGLLLAAACAMGPTAAFAETTPSDGGSGAGACEDQSAQVSVSSTSVNLGDSITVSGTCFTPRAEVTVKILNSDDPNSQADATPKAGADGSFSAELTPRVAGEYSAVVSTDEDGEITAQFTVVGQEEEPEPTPEDPSDPPVEDPGDGTDDGEETPDPGSTPDPGDDGDDTATPDPGDGTDDGTTTPTPGDGTDDGQNSGGDDSTGGAGDGSTGGDETGGSTGGDETGGSTGGDTSTGGSEDGSSENGDSTGGSETGGSETGGSQSGGQQSGGSQTGGNQTGGNQTGGSETGGQPSASAGNDSTSGQNTPPPSASAQSPTVTDPAAPNAATNPFPGSGNPTPSAAGQPAPAARAPQQPPAAPSNATNDFPVAIPEYTQAQVEKGNLALLMTSLFAHGVSEGQVGTAPADAHAVIDPATGAQNGQATDATGATAPAASDGGGESSEASDGGGELAETGTSVMLPAAVAVLALLGGVGAIWLQRRRNG